MPEPSIRIKVFKGIDNLSDNITLNPRAQSIYLREADNLNIDDDGKLHRRDGHEETPIFSSPNVHSFWSDGTISLFVDGTILKRLNTDYSTSVLVEGVDPTDRMCYLSINGIVYFSNRSIIGYIVDGLPYPFAAPEQTFKIKMIGGQALEFYNSRLYAANDKNLFFSDATVPTRMDKRKNAIAFPDYIPMVKSVLDGIYVGQANSIYFIKGSDPFSDFVQDKVYDTGVIEGTATAMDDDDIGRGMKGRVAYWIGTDGAVYKGLPSGVVIQCQEGLFEMKDLDIGTAVFKDDHGYTQYVAICSMKAGIGGASGEARVPRPTILSTD